MTLRLHNTLEWIEEDFNAGRITFREALEAYREEIEAEAYEVEYPDVREPRTYEE